MRLFVFFVLFLVFLFVIAAAAAVDQMTTSYVRTEVVDCRVGKTVTQWRGANQRLEVTGALLHCPGATFWVDTDQYSADARDSLYPGMIVKCQQEVRRGDYFYGVGRHLGLPTAHPRFMVNAEPCKWEKR